MCDSLINVTKNIKVLNKTNRCITNLSYFFNNQIDMPFCSNFIFMFSTKCSYMAAFSYKKSQCENFKTWATIYKYCVADRPSFLVF